MSSARLLLPIVLSCSLFAAGQTQRSQEFLTSSQSSQPNAAASQTLIANASATPSEPWRIVPPKPEVITDPLGRIVQAPGVRYKADHDSQLSVLREPGTDHTGISLDGSADDTACYAIRSYVVARDSKESEATHPAGYSTCQPASRYRLRTTDISR